MADNHTYSGSATLIQQGVSTGVGDWTTVALGSSVGFAFGWRAGLIYEVTVTLDSTMTPPRTLDAPLMTDLGDLSMALTVTSLPITFDVSVVREPYTALFSSSSGPFDRTLDSLSTGWLAFAATPATVTFSSANEDLVRAQITSRAWWNGRVALVLAPSSGGPANLVPPTSWTWTLGRFFNGLNGSYVPGTRAVRDHRFGIPILGDQLVEDGYKPGIWVRATDADPDEEIDTYLPDPREGVVLDEIGD